MRKRARTVGRRAFVRGIGAVSVAALAAPGRAAHADQDRPALPGAVLQATEGLRIPPTPDARVVTIKVDSEAAPGVRMSMIAEDIPPGAEIRVHLHQREDEIIFIRMGTGIATLGDREVPVSARARRSTCHKVSGTACATTERSHSG
jgi:mannose-6-phosphate isomerase-like protein (cupin superfamily)